MAETPGVEVVLGSLHQQLFETRLAYREAQQGYHNSLVGSEERAEFMNLQTQLAAIITSINITIAEVMQLPEDADLEEQGFVFFRDEEEKESQK